MANWNRTTLSIFLTLVLTVFASCGGMPTITSPTQGQLVSFAGASSVQLNVSNSANSFGSMTVTIYQVNSLITGSCATSSNYAVCTLTKSQSGGSCSTNQPCDAAVIMTSGSNQQEVLIKFTF